MCQDLSEYNLFFHLMLLFKPRAGQVGLRAVTFLNRWSHEKGSLPFFGPLKDIKVDTKIKLCFK